MAAAVASPLQPLPSSTQDERGSALKDYLSKTHHYYARVAETSIPESNSHAADVEYGPPWHTRSVHVVGRAKQDEAAFVLLRFGPLTNFLRSGTHHKHLDHIDFVALCAW